MKRNENSIDKGIKYNKIMWDNQIWTWLWRIVEESSQSDWGIKWEVKLKDSKCKYTYSKIDFQENNFYSLWSLKILYVSIQQWLNMYTRIVLGKQQWINRKRTYVYWNPDEDIPKLLTAES